MTCKMMTEHTVQLEFNRAKFRFSLRHNNAMCIQSKSAETNTKYGVCAAAVATATAARVRDTNAQILFNDLYFFGCILHIKITRFFFFFSISRDKLSISFQEIPIFSPLKVRLHATSMRFADVPLTSNKIVWAIISK